MKVMTAHIVFEAYKGLQAFAIVRPNAVQVESGYELLTDRATIVLPRNVPDFDKKNVKDVFVKGRPVTIQLGYNGDNVTEFTGYITRVSADMPIKIELEDEMYQLKKLPVHLSTKSIGLPDFIKKIAPGYQTDVAEWQMPPQRHIHTTAAKVLDYLKSEYNLFSYFKGKTLVVGKIYDDDTGEPVRLHLEQNTKSRANDLKYRDKDEVLIKIKAVSTLHNGQKIEVEVGDDNGTEQRLSYYGIEVKAELKKAAQRDYEKYKVSGFDGSLTTFGQPYITHGMKVTLESDQYPDRNGTYYVDKTVTEWSNSSGYQRKLKLGKKANG